MKRVLCYGDSDTWGCIAGTGQRRERRWTKVCRQVLGEEYEIIEDGLNGRTTAFDHPTNPWLNGMKGLGYALFSNRPLDAVVVFLGANDVLYTDAEGSGAGAAQLVEAILKPELLFSGAKPVFAGAPKVLLISTPLSHPDIDKVYPGAKIAVNAPEIHKYAAIYSQIAARYDIDFLDAKLYAECSEVDCVHMTGESHVRLGEAVADKLRKMLEE